MVIIKTNKNKKEKVVEKQRREKISKLNYNVQLIETKKQTKEKEGKLERMLDVRNN